MPDPKKKLNLDLSGYKGGSKLNLDLSDYSEVKKKESSQPTSQEDVWGSNSQPKDAYTSLVTDQQIPQQGSGISDGEQPKMRTLGVDITAEEALKPTAKKIADKLETAKPYIKKTQLKKELASTKVTAENQDEVNRKIEEVSKLNEQTKLIEKERFDRIEQDFVNSKDTEYAESEADNRLNDLLSNTGVWNNVKSFAKNSYNSIIEGASSNPLNSSLLSLTIDTDPLSDEKKLVRQQAAKDKVKLSEQEVFEKAKQVYKDKQIENIEDDRIASFLEDLPEDDKIALKQDRYNTSVHLQEENVKTEKAINAYTVFGNKKMQEYKDIEGQLKLLKEQGIAFPEDLYNKYTSLSSDIKNISKNIQKRQDSLLKNKSDLGTAKQEFDLLKRQYGDVENFLSNTSIAARELGIGIIGGIDYLSSIANPITSGSSIGLQSKLIDINKGLAEERDNLRKSVESIESVEGLLNYSSDVLSNQLPNLVATSTGAGGLALMGVSGAGQKYAEMNQEVLEGKASYSPLQMAVAPLLYGGAEVISEIPTLSILKKGGRVIESIARNEADLLTKTAFQKGKEFARDFAGDQLKEGGGEEFTNLGQNFTNIFILGKKNIGLLDNTGTVLKDTFTLTSMLKVAPHLAGLALKPFQSKVDLGLLDENARKIIEFSRNLNTLNLSDDEKLVLENQIKKATEENSKIMANTIDNVANMPDSVYLKVNEINKKAAQLKDDAKVINDGNLPNKPALLKDLENQYRDLQIERSSLINTKYSPYAQLESLPAEELIDLKNEAQRKLMSELNPEGDKNITITDDQISKEALNIYKEKNKSEVTAEAPTIEVTQETTPAVEGVSTEVLDIEKRRSEELNNIIQGPAIEVLDENGNVISTTDKAVEINAKYDAELEALKNKATPKSNTLIETTPQAYVEELAKTKESDPEAYWSVSEVSAEDAAKGTIIDTADGSALVKPDGDIAGVFKKLASKAKGVAQDLLNKAVEAGGIKLDNFDGYLTKQYEKAGFRVVSRTPFNEQYAPEGWNKEKHGTPDVVAMVYDPNNELDIEEKTFDDYDQAISYRDGFVGQAKALTTEANTVQEVIDESEKSNDLPSLVQKAKTALSKILPGTGIILYNTEAEYKAAINEGADENSGGAFVKGKIHINPKRANGRTVAHEVFHAILLNIVKTDPEAKRVTAAMMAAIEKVLPADMKAKLQDFVENGYDAESDLWNEEKLAELVGYLAENFSSLSQPAKNIIKEWLDKLAKLVGIKEFTDKEVIDLMNTISGKIASGEVITEEDVEILSGGKKISNPFDYFKRKQVGAFDVKYTEQEKLDKLINDKLVTKPENLDFLSGKETSITSPDDMLAGTISIDGKEIFEGGGGVFFVTKYGDVWASGNKGTANTLARSINNSFKKNGDKGYLVLAKGSDSKLISSASGVNSSLAVLDSMIDKGLVSPSDFRSAVSESIKRFGGNISLNGSAKQLKEDVNNYFSDPKSSTFEVRGSVLGSIINSLAKSKNTKLNKDKIIEFLGGDKNKGLVALTTKENKSKNQSLSDLISGVAAEQLTKGLNVGDVYAVIEVDGEVMVKEDSHPSYPFHIVPVGKNKPVLHLPKTRQNGAELLTTSTGKPYKVGQVSIMSGSFNGSVRKQISSNSDSFFENADVIFPNDHVLGGYAVTDTNNKLIGRVKMSKVDNNTVKIDEVVSEKRGEGTGNGTKIMNMIIENADKTNTTLKLTPNLILGLKAKGFDTVEKLRSFYSKFGFIKDKGLSTMTRNPEMSELSRKQIIGEKAVKDKLVQDNLDVAKNMEAENKSAKDIFVATGWEKGADKKWKYDLQEGVVEIKSKKSGKASDVLNYPELFKAYPKAKDLDIVFMNSDKFEGMYLPSKNRIMLSNSLSDSELKSTLLHEVQHFVQHEEGFAVGGQARLIRDLYNERIKYEKNFSVKKVLNNIKNSLFGSNKNEADTKKELDKLGKLVSKVDEDLYRSIAGEVEAFNVEKRSTMTTEQRRSTPISETADVPVEEQLVVSDSDIMLKDRKQNSRPTVDEIYEESNKAISDLENTRDYKQFLNDAYRRVFERQKNIKDLITSFGNKSAKNAYNRLVTKSGASGLASFEFKEASKKIYGGLKKSDLSNLDKIIYAKRIKSINESRLKEGRPLYKGMKGYSLDDANADLKRYKFELGDKKFEDLNNRASEYFNEYRKSLRDLYDSGRISKETYEKFKNDEYSPIKTIKYILSPNTSTEEIDMEAKRFGMSKKDIMKLSDENDNAIIMDSKWLLATTINANKSRAFENKMLNEFNKAFEGLSKEEKEGVSDYIVENPVIGKRKDNSLKYKYDNVELPNGFRKVVFFENGNKKEIIIDKKYADQLLDVKNQHKLLKFIGAISGTGVLRFFATGGNPLFIFGNVANDFQNILYNTDVYSDFLPLATVQIARDFVKNFVKKALLNDTYNNTYKEYLSHGGALDQMSRDGLQALESRNIANKLGKGLQKGLLATGNFMSYLGNTSETAFRLAVYDKYKDNLISKFKKENGRNPNSQELDDIMWDAARESRETMPFDQGGDLSKAANIVMPYFNAALQGFRKFATFAVKNPRRFGRNILQYAAMSGTLSATSFAMLLAGIRDDEDDEEKSLKEMIIAWQSVSNYEKANYHIFFTGKKDENGEYEYYRIKKLPVFSILSTAAEEALLKSFLSSKGVDYKFDSDPVKEAVIKSMPIPLTAMELFSKNPAVSAFVSYTFNTDTFTGEKIFREPKGKKILPEAEVNNKTNQVYKDLGSLTGLSPARSKVAVEKVITAETTNPAIPLMYSSLDGLFHKKDGFGKEVSDAMSSVLDAFGKKVVRYTNKDIISYKKQDELEYKEAVIETEIWKSEQKVYDEIKEVYSSGKKLDRNGFKNIIDSNFKPIDREKYAKKYKAYINNMGANREVLDIIFEDVPEVQAMKLNERYGNSFDEEELKELEDIARKSQRPISKKAKYIYYEKYKNRKPAN